jgi:hypothetical protein
VEVVVEELQQECLLPMEMEAISGVIPWSEEQNEETYEKEPQTSSPAAKTVPPSPKPLPATERVEQKSSTAVADAPPHMPAKVPVSVAGPGPGAGDNEAATHHEIHGWQLKLMALFAALDSSASKAASLLRDRIGKASIPMVWSRPVTALVLISMVLAAYLSAGDSDQPVRELETLAMSQITTQQLVEPATEDREPGSVQPQPQPDTPSTETQASSGARNSASEAVGKTWGREKIFAAPATENRRPPALELATMETSLPVSPVAIVDTGKTPTLETANDVNAEQSKPGEDEPVPAREDGPVIAPSQGSQANKAADPSPAKKVNVPPTLSKEEKIAELREHGWRSLKQDRLLVAKNNNAYHYFQRVLKLDPGNIDALHGIEQIVARYTMLATDALDENDKKKAEQHIARGFSISPNSEDLIALRDRMNAPSVKVASEQPPPVVIPFPEPKPEGFLMRVKTFFVRQPNGKFEDLSQTDEP